MSLSTLGEGPRVPVGRDKGSFVPLLIYASETKTWPWERGAIGSLRAKTKDPLLQLNSPFQSTDVANTWGNPPKQCRIKNTWALAHRRN